MTSRERLLKKRPRLIEVDGDKIPVRSLTIAEHLRVDAINAEGKQNEAMFFILSCAVLNDDGKQEFSGPDDQAIQDIPFELVPLITDKIQKISRAQRVVTLEKNSEATP